MFARSEEQIHSPHDLDIQPSFTAQHVSFREKSYWEIYTDQALTSLMSMKAQMPSLSTLVPLLMMPKLSLYR